MPGRAYGGDMLDAPSTWEEWELQMSSLTGSTRDQRAGLGTVLAATRNTSLYSDQPSLFACLLSWLAPPSPISLRQSPQLDNGSDVVLLRSNGHKAGSYSTRRSREDPRGGIGIGSTCLGHQPIFQGTRYYPRKRSVKSGYFSGYPPAGESDTIRGRLPAIVRLTRASIGGPHAKPEKEQGRAAK